MKENAKPIINDGVDPRTVLNQRGVDYEGGSFVPELPDYLGYILGLLILWLVYTGYQTIHGMVKDPNGTIATLTPKVTEKVEALKNEPLLPSVELTKENAVQIIKTNKSTWRSYLESTNKYINDASKALASYASEVIPKHDELSSDRNRKKSSSTHRPLSESSGRF